MAELIINSVPSGADVTIDGEIVGTTPLVIPIEISLEAFRAECLTDGAVSCDWNTLHARLNNHDVSRLWWLLTESERRSIAKHAVSNTINKVIWYYRRGESGGWMKLPSPCTYNAIIRFQKFGTPIGWYDCYWKYDSGSTDAFRYAPEHYFGLPTVHVNTVTHVMCGIQVVNSIDDLNNWIVFQYGSFDIKPGHAQMPYGKRVIIQDPFPYTGTLDNCIGFDSRVITEFQI